MFIDIQSKGCSATFQGFAQELNDLLMYKYEGSISRNIMLKQYFFNPESSEVK